MKAFLLRHADAHYTSPDETRTLTDEGRQSIRKLGKALQGKNFPELPAIWHSQLTRAFQTAEILRDIVFPDLDLVETQGLCPMDSPSILAEKLSTMEQSAFLVGHNPHLSELSCLLMGPSFNITFKKSALLCVERLAPSNPKAPYGFWSLRYFLPSKIL